MCGIVGILGREPVAPALIEALKRLEYRGYDSAGVATLENGRLTRLRASGKLRNLQDKLKETPLSGHIGLGHTRWATHGRPNETNAHPHASDKVAVVHNGIIENFRELREELTAKGHVFATETDSEVVAHLVAEEMRQGSKPREAVAAALGRLKGAVALGFLFDGELDLLIGARRGSPLAVGFGDDGVYLGSDALALAPFATEIAYLEEDDWVTLTREKTTFFDAAGRIVERARRPLQAGSLMVDKGNYRHYMAKEIHEQPGGRRAHAGALSRSRLWNRAAAVRTRLRRQGAVARDHFGLRNRLLRRARRALLAGALRAAFGRDRHRLGVSLPRGAAAGSMTKCGVRQMPATVFP